jgi:cold shock CspA family protein
MNSALPSVETLTLIARVLSSRVTPVSEIGAVISALCEVADLIGHDSTPAPVQAPLDEAPRRAAVAKRAPRAVSKAKPPQIEPAPAAAPAIFAPAIVVAPEPEISQSRLVRRADVLAHDAATHHHEPAFLMPNAPERTLRGVVKWFDARTSKGALRLTGVSGDVPLTADNLGKAGIKRLYKDQEIEARIEQLDGRTRVLSLSLPTRSNGSGSADNRSGTHSSPMSATRNRQSGAISVQIKLDSSRQREARAAAESLLGPIQMEKSPR